MADYYAMEIKELLEMANRGDVQAQNELGKRYCEGTGIEKNSDEALRWLRIAAENGSVAARRNLNEYFYMNDEDDEYKLAVALYYGRDGKSQNKEEAMKWLKKAVLHGSPFAMYFLSKCYRYGIDVEKDVSKAVEYLQYLSDPYEGIGFAGDKDLLEIYWNGEDDGFKNFEGAEHLLFWGRYETGDEIIAEAADLIYAYGLNQCEGIISFKYERFHWDLVHDASFEQKFKHLTSWYHLTGGIGKNYGDAIIVTHCKNWNVEIIPQNITRVLYPNFNGWKWQRKSVKDKLYDVVTVSDEAVDDVTLYFDVTCLKNNVNRN